MITCPRVLNVCPKTILLPRWPRDAKRLDAPGPEVPGVCIHWSVCVHVCEIPEDSVVCTCVPLGDHSHRTQMRLAGRFLEDREVDMTVTCHSNAASLLLGVGKAGPGHRIRES